MKKLLIILTVFGALYTIQAQVAIGKNSVTNASVILEFADGTTNGINLPMVTTLPTASSSINGTILFDRNDAKVKWCQNESWVDLSNTGSVAGVTLNTSPSFGAGVVIGANNNPLGVLELRASDKAMILPKIVSPEINVKSPLPGMICYDTNSRSLAVFDGVKWNYWN